MNDIWPTFTVCWKALTLRWPIAMDWHPSSSVVRRALHVTSSSQEIPGKSELNLVCSICMVRRQEILFHEPHPKGGNFGVKSVKLLYFFNNLFLYSQALIRQTKHVVMMTKEGSTNILNFMTPGQGFLC